MFIGELGCFEEAGLSGLKPHVWRILTARLKAVPYPKLCGSGLNQTFSKTDLIESFPVEERGVVTDEVV